MNGLRAAKCHMVLDEVFEERLRQELKFPNQRLPDGTHGRYGVDAAAFRIECHDATESGTVTWRHVLLEEVYEALAETDAAKLRAELIQTAAVCCRWVQQIDERGL